MENLYRARRTFKSPGQLRVRGYVTIAGTWQDLRDQMSLKPRDPRKNVQGREIATIPLKTTGNRAWISSPSRSAAISTLKRCLRVLPEVPKKLPRP